MMMMIDDDDDNVVNGATGSSCSSGPLSSLIVELFSFQQNFFVNQSKCTATGQPKLLVNWIRQDDELGVWKQPFMKKLPSHFVATELVLQSVNTLRLLSSTMLKITSSQALKLR